MLAYRTSTQESTGCTPFYLMFGREARLPADVMFGLPPNSTSQQVNQYALDLRARLENAYRLVRDHMGIQHLRQKTLYDKSVHGDPYKAAELMWLHCPAVQRGKSPKLHRYWQGSYTVVRSLGDALFLIQHRDSPRIPTVVHFDRMKPCMYGSGIRGECCTSQGRQHGGTSSSMGLVGWQLTVTLEKICCGMNPNL